VCDIVSLLPNRIAHGLCNTACQQHGHRLFCCSKRWQTAHQYRIFSRAFAR
jgi:hypothetical protein